jgi:hypothetical protein
MIAMERSEIGAGAVVGAEGEEDMVSVPKVRRLA